MATHTIDKFTFDGNTYNLEDSGAQRTLVSGTNIKTINNESILGSGNITVSGSGGTDEKLSVTQQDDTESSKIYPVLSTSSSTASKKKYSNLLTWTKGELTLGGTGSDSSKYAGGLNLYNSSGKYITLKYLTTAASNRTIYLPDKAGTDVTLACTTDLNGKASGNGEIIYGTCSTAAATRKKEVFCSYYNGLHTGMIAVVDFSYINTDAYPQLNLYTTGNGGGTKYIKENIGGTISNLTNPSSLNGTCIFVYNGTNWVLQHTDSVSGSGSGTVTSVGVSNATNGGLSVSGSPVTSSGTITIGHSNSITAGTIGSSSASQGSTIDIPYATYDSNGHVTGAGTHTHTITGFSTATNLVNGSGNSSIKSTSANGASASNTVALGQGTSASGVASHAFNNYTQADQDFQTVVGTYNTLNDTNSLFAVGNGSITERSTAFSVYSNGNIKAENAILAGGNIQDGSGNVLSDKVDSAGFFKVVDLSWTEPAINAHSYGTNTTHTVASADRPAGMTLVGIVGWQSGNYRIYPYVFRTNDEHSITVTMANATTGNSVSATVHAYLLYIKATSA